MTGSWVPFISTMVAAQKVLPGLARLSPQRSGVQESQNAIKCVLSSFHMFPHFSTFPHIFPFWLHIFPGYSWMPPIFPIWMASRCFLPNMYQNWTFSGPCESSGSAVCCWHLSSVPFRRFKNQWQDWLTKLLLMHFLYEPYRNVGPACFGPWKQGLQLLRWSGLCCIELSFGTEQSFQILREIPIGSHRFALHFVRQWASSSRALLPREPGVALTSSIASTWRCSR